MPTAEEKTGTPVRIERDVLGSVRYTYTKQKNETNPATDQ